MKKREKANILAFLMFEANILAFFSRGKIKKKLKKHKHKTKKLENVEISRYWE